jgi:hypothetical protein
MIRASHLLSESYPPTPEVFAGRQPLGPICLTAGSLIVLSRQGEVRYIRLAVRTVLAERFKLGLIFRGTHAHHVPSDMHAPWSRHDPRNQFIKLFVELSGCLHQRRIVAHDH